MKHLLVLSTAFMALTACASTSTARYGLQMDVTDSLDVERLTQQTINVMERRLESFGSPLHDSETETTVSGSVIISVTADNQEVLGQLSDAMVSPFDFAIMSQAQEGETPDATVEKLGGFVRTGITGEDLSWVEAEQVAENGQGRVHLIFTLEGRDKIADLFRKMNGKNIGIFVRNQLISLLHVETGELKDDIVIEQIPSFELAEAFADDVNVGIHVTVTPLP